MLGRRDALAVAASCVEKLRGCGAVSITPTPLIADVNTRALSWLEIAVEGEKLAKDQGLQWTNLREAVAMLHALSRCAGYAPHLNIEFWRQALEAAGVGGALYDLSAARFDPDFPRFRLIFSHNESNATTPEHEVRRITKALRRLFSLNSADSPISASFAAIKAKLQPFQSPSRVRPVEIALSLPSMDTRWLLPAMSKLTVDLRDTKTVLLKEVALNERRHRPQDPLQGVAWLTDLEGVSCFSDWTLDESIEDPRVYGRLYQRVLGLQGTNVTPIRMLHVERSALSDAQFAGLCSALPFSQTVETVRIFVDPDWDWDALGSEWDWAWLGYALCHAKTADSKWRGLVLEGCGLSLEHAEIVEKLRRRGVNALSEYVNNGSRGIDCTREETTVVRLAVEATLYSASNCEALTTLDGDDIALEDFDCFETSSPSDVASMIVPGYGVVVVESKQIVSTKQRQASPCSCCLRSFTASHDRGHNGSAQGLRLFLETCGAALRSLDLLQHEALGSLDVYNILQSCPQLEEIALNHDGTLWSSPLPSHSTRLKAIRLSCSLVEAYCTVSALCEEGKAAFPSVDALYFHVTKGAVVFHSISKALGGRLLGNPTIADFALVKVRHTSSSPSRLTTERLAKSLSAMSISADDLGFPGIARLQTEALAALETLCSKSGLPHEVCKRVVGFVAVENPRHVWIDLL